MSIGFDKQQNVVTLGDSADLYAYLYDREDASVDVDTLIAVVFTIEYPDKTRDTFDGEITDEGYGYFRFEDTTQAGEYRAVATFELEDGRKQSTRSDFEVQDPFDAADPTHAQIVSERVWKKITDCFDSNDGGPWMRDMTLTVFNENRIPDFIDEALFDINVYNPPTNLSLAKFAQPLNNNPNPDLSLIVQGTFIQVIRHLMRTYTEQPLPAGGQVTYEDRRDYLQRWGTIYQIEFQHYDHLVKLWKRRFLGLGSTKSLVSSKAGRLLPAPLRARGVGRGYY